MFSQENFDSFCFNKDCVSKKHALFRFDEQNEHIVNQHDVRQIHPRSLFYLFKNKTDVTPLQQTNQTYFNHLKQLAHSSAAEIAQFLTQKLFGEQLRALEDELYAAKKLDLNTLVSNLSKGDNNALISIREFDEQEDGNFAQFVQKKLMDKCRLQQEKIYFQKIKLYHFLQGFFKFQQSNLPNLQSVDRHSQMPIQTPAQPFEITAQPIQKSAQPFEKRSQLKIEPSEFQRQFRQKMVKLQYNQEMADVKPVIFGGEQAEQSEDEQQQKSRYLIKREQEQDQSESQHKPAYNSIKKEPAWDNYLIYSNAISAAKNHHQPLAKETDQGDEKSGPKYQKTKKIEKASKEKPKGCLPKKKAYNFQKIGLQTQGQPIVYNIVNIDKAFNTINKNINLTEVKAIHIFDKRFITEASLRRVFNSYPHLKTITFNCSFNLKILSKFIPQSKRLEQLRLVWAYQRFYLEYHLQRHFPMQVEDKKRLSLAENIPAELWSQRDCKSVTLARSNFHRYGSMLPTLFLKLKVLQVTGQVLNYELADTLLQKLTILTALKIVNHKIATHSQKLAKLLINNPLLEHLYIDNFQTLNRSHNQMADDLQFILSLKQLKYLTSLSLSCPPGQHLTIYTHLFKVSQFLTFLSLENIAFDHGHSSECSHPFSFLKELRYLRQLSLAGCRPINWSLFQHLNPVSFPRLTYLNLANTNVDDGCKKYLSQLTNLEYLNVDCTSIGSEVLSEVFKNHYLKYNKYHPLKYLSIQQPKRTYRELFASNPKSFMALYYSQLLDGQVHSCRLADISIMAQYLPQIQYLNIAHNPHLSLFAFDLFERLRMMAVDAITYTLMRSPKLKTKIYIVDG